MRIKTIRNRLDNAERFDEEVNNALADGWILVKRVIVPAYEQMSYAMLVAELEREKMDGDCS